MINFRSVAQGSQWDTNGPSGAIAYNQSKYVLFILTSATTREWKTMRFSTGILQSYDKMPKIQTFCKQISSILTPTSPNRGSTPARLHINVLWINDIFFNISGKCHAPTVPENGQSHHFTLLNTPQQRQERPLSHCKQSSRRPISGINRHACVPNPLQNTPKMSSNHKICDLSVFLMNSLLSFPGNLLTLPIRQYRERLLSL